MRGRRTRHPFYPALFPLLGMLLLGSPAGFGAGPSPDCKPVQSRPLALTLNKSRVITLEQAVGKLSVGTPNIANVPDMPKQAPPESVDYLMVSRGQILLVGKSPGSTNLIVWDETGCVIAIYDVEVSADLSTLQSKLHDVLPAEKNIKVHAAQNTIVLSGEVSNPARLDAAVRLANAFAGKQGGGGRGGVVNIGGAGGPEQSNVINMLQVGGVQQVMLEVKVAEVQRSILKKLGFKTALFSPQGSFGFGAVKGGASFPQAQVSTTPSTEFPQPEGGVPGAPLVGTNSGTSTTYNPVIGPLVNLFQPATPTISDAGLFLYSLSKNLLFDTVIDALKDNGLAKLLAEPTLTALSGQEANFLSGGEIPIPVAQDNNRTTIEYKKYGVQVKFQPLVLDAGRIGLRTHVAVSEPDYTNQITVSTGSNQFFSIPAFRTRDAQSNVELADGQTIAIAGLIDERVRESAQKLPGLGEIPVLGLLFSSEEFQKGQTELIMFVTPHLAQPTPPQQVRLPTEAFVEPSDVEFYLLGKLEGERRPQLFDPRAQGGGMEGSFGHGL